MAREKRWDVDVEGYDLSDLSMSHSCVRVRTHCCSSVRRYRETVSQLTPAMKEWGEEIAASSECQKGCPKEQIDEDA